MAGYEIVEAGKKADKVAASKRKRAKCAAQCLREAMGSSGMWQPVAPVVSTVNEYDLTRMVDCPVVHGLYIFTSTYLQYVLVVCTVSTYW